MEITEVKVFPVSEERLKAYATITFYDCFIIRDLKIINGNNGLFVAMPSKKRKDGTFRDIAHPLNNETREMIEGVVLKEYENELEKVDFPEQSEPPEEDSPEQSESPEVDTPEQSETPEDD